MLPVQLTKSWAGKAGQASRPRTGKYAACTRTCTVRVLVHIRRARHAPAEGRESSGPRHGSTRNRRVKETEPVFRGRGFRARKKTLSTGHGLYTTKLNYRVTLCTVLRPHPWHAHCTRCRWQARPGVYDGGSRACRPRATRPGAVGPVKEGVVVGPWQGVWHHERPYRNLTRCQLRSDLVQAAVSSA